MARDAAMAAGLVSIDIAERDIDVPLSALGAEQSTALGKWFAGMPLDERPTAVISSTYLRARQTVDRIEAAGGMHPQAGHRVDERLREREFGILDRLTRLGIEQHFPDEAAARTRIGKFYHRPPGGESWCDVILRLRSVLDTVSLHYSRPGSRVLIVAHQVIVLCFRYLIEEMTEEQILTIDREAEVANCGLTEYAITPNRESPAAEGRKLRLIRYNVVAPLVEAGAAITAEPDRPAGPR